MRLWTISPGYLDSKGLTAAWREALLAKKVLTGKTRGYKNHPQLKRFRESGKPLETIDTFLYYIHKEACVRGYKFDKRKAGKQGKKKIKASSGQVKYEFNFLKKKLRQRAPGRYGELMKVKRIKLNNLFVKVRGWIEEWEKVKN